MAKNKKQLEKEAKSLPKEEKPEKGKHEGCENCNNTGLEPGVARDTAQVCPVCNGSPFEKPAKKEEAEESEDEELEEESEEEDEDNG